MKFTRRLALCASTLLLGVTSASAAVTISNATLSINGAEILNTGTLVFAWDTNGNGVADPIVNGITFNKVQPGSVSFNANFSTQLDQATTSNLYSPNADMAELMGSFTANNGNAQNVVMTVSGLTIGQQYRIQLLHHQAAQSAGTRDMEIHFGSLVTDPGSGAFDMGGNVGRIVTATFDATATSQNFLIRVGSNDRSILNGAVLFAVPEPSAALLGGLGLLTLLRRRRH